MRIKQVYDDGIEFDNGKFIHTWHNPCCCEENYADFTQLEEDALTYDFNEDLKFEEVAGSGFRFGDERRMFFIPCYSIQNGYYSMDVEVWYDGKQMLEAEAEWQLK